MILPATNGASKDVDDLYGDQFTVALARAAATLECAPYWHSGEKAPSRLVRAQELVRHSRVILQDDRLATVHGATKAYDLNGFHCTCPQAQKGQSSWCVHAVAVKLARTMASQAPREEALPLGPATVDERLAQAVSDTQARAIALDTVPEAALPLVAPREEGPVYVTHDGTRYTLPEGEIMADDDAEYIPEPNVPSVALLDAPERKEEKKETPRPLPGPVLLPSLDARTLEQSMQAYAAQRAVVTRYIKEQMTEGVDYYTLTIKGRVSKATLSKAGSEKFLSLFQLHAAFQQDHATWQMLGAKEGLLCYTCTLMTRSGEVIGEGRGARSVTQDGGDINKAIKMATKSAQVDAVLRTGALSDVFTQDLDDQPPPATPAKPTAQSQDLRKRIWAEVNRQAPQVKTQDDAEAWVQERTGLAMEPDQYQAILTALTQGVGR